MLVGQASFLAYGAQVDGIYYNFSGTNATVTYKTTSYNSYSGNVVIPASVTYNGTTYNVTSIGSRAFSGCTGLTSITIPSSVTSIGNEAFRGCAGLTSIEIPSSVTSIGESAFQDCTSLTSIEIPCGVTNISGGTFSGCSSLVSITLPFVGDKPHTATDTYQYPFGYIFGTVNNYTLSLHP